jgi:hypothetical protein
MKRNLKIKVLATVEAVAKLHLPEAGTMYLAAKELDRSIGAGNVQPRFYRNNKGFYP